MIRAHIWGSAGLLFGQVAAADIMSMANGGVGLWAMGRILGGADTSEGEIFLLAFGAVLTCSVLDVLDGIVARRLGSSRFGKILDATADFISFGLLSAVSVYRFIEDSDVLAGALALLIVVATGWRLVRFAIQDDGRFDSYEGLPAPMAALAIFAGLALFGSAIWRTVLILGIVLLMVSELSFPKARNVKLWIVLCWLCATGSGIILWMADYSVGREIARGCAALQIAAVAVLFLDLVERSDHGADNGDDYKFNGVQRLPCTEDLRSHLRLRDSEKVEEVRNRPMDRIGLGFR